MRRFYLCKKCGNVVSMIVKGGGSLVCCGEKMEELVPNTVDASAEKHVPQYDVRDDKIVVQVGEIMHPMDEDHYINFVALEYGDTIEIHNFKPGDEPVWVFDYQENATIYEYCNKHGLWKADVN